MLYKFHVLSFGKRSRFQELAVCTGEARVCHKEEDEVEMGWACLFSLLTPLFSVLKFWQQILNGTMNVMTPYLTNCTQTKQ